MTRSQRYQIRLKTSVNVKIEIDLQEHINVIGS